MAAPILDILDIIIIGTPRPQPRARIFRNGGRATDSPHSREWKRNIMAVARSAGSAPVAIGQALELELTLAMPVKDKRLHGRPHTGRRDFDNLAKAVVDALQDAGVMADDGQISDAVIRKRYAAHPGGARIILRLVA